MIISNWSIEFLQVFNCTLDVENYFNSLMMSNFILVNTTKINNKQHKSKPSLKFTIKLQIVMYLSEICER